MANSKHVELLKQGPVVWNAWRREQSVRIDLRRSTLHWADLRGADLHLANIQGSNLEGADLHEADLRGADLGVTNLRGANLEAANLERAYLDGTDLSNSRLNEADLRLANFGDVKLQRADFRKAILGRTWFGNVDLRFAEGLDSVRHSGPSHIGIDTFYRSLGQIPESFMRGAGVPDNFVTYLRSLTVSPIEFYSCFISYSSQDQEFAERLHADLRSKNLRCWFAPEDLKIGDRFQERIEESIRLYDKVVIVLSEASVKSRWVEREMNAAFEREQSENRAAIVPIRLDNAVLTAMQPWAADIRRSRHIGDFSSWKDHDCYRKSFERLIRDLQTRLDQI